MKSATTDTEELVLLARAGDEAARDNLLAVHRERLRRMVAVRMDQRLCARLDPSDVVQEALLDAAGRLTDYLRERPIPFYPWLRRLTWEVLCKIHTRHLRRDKRSVVREYPGGIAPSDRSTRDLAQWLVDSGTSPSGRAVKGEMAVRVRSALDELGALDREVLVLRYLEQLATREIAAVLEITEGAVKVRHLRALERLRTALDGEPEKDNR